jgi:hypothetical protein
MCVSRQSVPEFRLALTSFMEEAGLLQSSEDEESGENLHARAAAPDLSRMLSVFTPPPTCEETFSINI